MALKILSNVLLAAMHRFALDTVSLIRLKVAYSSFPPPHPKCRLFERGQFVALKPILISGDPTNDGRSQRDANQQGGVARPDGFLPGRAGIFSSHASSPVCLTQ
jgi:hypothetical protein